MKKGLVFLMVCLGFVAAQLPAEAREKVLSCRFTQLGDFSTSVGKSQNPCETRRRDINKFQDGESCNQPIETVNQVTGKNQLLSLSPVQVCSGMVECEVAPDADDESVVNLTYETVACSTNKDGTCPGALDCRALQKKQGYTVTALSTTDHPDAGKAPTLDPAKVGEKCAINNSDLSFSDCQKFCTSRCRKLFAENKDGEIDSCISELSACKSK